jgi:hypothetical protein
MSMTHHNQINELTTWFLNLPLDESIENKRHKVQSSNSRAHEAKLEEQKPIKSSRMSFSRRKNRKANKRHKERQTKQNGEEELRKDQNQNKTSKKSSTVKKSQKLPMNQTSPNTLSLGSIK